MKIYIAHNFEARRFLREHTLPFYEKNGHQVTSRWITDDAHLEASKEALSAVHDLEDIDSAGALILFSNQFGERPGKGKFFELGYAVRSGKICIVIGDDRSCIFYNLPNIRHAKNMEDSLKYLVETKNIRTSA